jgi:hypothetical protein
VVRVSVFLRILLVQFLRELQVGVDLEGECFREGENLGRLSVRYEVTVQDCGVRTLGKNGISGPYLSRTDLPTSCGFFLM